VTLHASGGTLKSAAENKYTADWETVHVDWVQPRHSTLIGKWLRAIRIALRAILAWFGLAVLATAHIADHPEWDRILSASRNQENLPCCSRGDAHLVEFDDWRHTNDGNYEVYLRGEWHRIEPWKITTNVVNPTGKAIVWYELVACEWADCASNTGWVWILCFKPLETY